MEENPQILAKLISGFLTNISNPVNNIEQNCPSSLSSDGPLINGA